MNKLTLMSIAASGMFLLAGCGGGSSGSPMQGPAPPVTTVPVAPPVAPAPQPTAEPDPGPMGKPDFTAYLSQVVAGPESDVPAVTDEIEFAYPDEEDDSVFATLLDM